MLKLEGFSEDQERGSEEDLLRKVLMVSRGAGIEVGHEA